jgi:hypothetical protein
MSTWLLVEAWTGQRAGGARRSHQSADAIGLQASSLCSSTGRPTPPAPKPTAAPACTSLQPASGPPLPSAARPGTTPAAAASSWATAPPTSDASWPRAGPRCPAGPQTAASRPACSATTPTTASRSRATRARCGAARRGLRRVLATVVRINARPTSTSPPAGVCWRAPLQGPKLTAPPPLAFCRRPTAASRRMVPRAAPRPPPPAARTLRCLARLPSPTLLPRRAAGPRP